MKKSGIKISIIGAGNVAWHLAPELEKAGHEIVAVYSRTSESAAALANRLANAVVLTEPDFSKISADLFLIAVKDSVLPELLERAIFPKNSLLAHTSGTLPLNVFEANKQVRGAVFYPLQTFSKQTPVNFQEISICLETTAENAMLLLQKVARSVSRQVYEISSENRKILHLAAVFACNFTNHLFGISTEILKTKNLDFELLKPLIEQTVAKAFTQHPFAVQTGPAIRHDENTIQTQLQLLAGEPVYRSIYELLSRSIQEKGPA